MEMYTRRLASRRKSQKGTDNANKGTDNANKGTDNANKGTDNASKAPYSAHLSVMRRTPGDATRNWACKARLKLRDSRVSGLR
jgi:hypothetical protein